MCYHSDIMALQAGYVIVGLVVLLIGKTSAYTNTSASLASIPHEFIQDSETSINLDANSIQVLGDNAFSQYNSLVTLSIKHNSISDISATAFDGTRLKVLHLERNNLAYIPDLNKVSSTLEELYLNNNNILQGRADFHLAVLHTLNLGRNKLHSFPDIPGAGSIILLKINYNPIDQTNNGKTRVLHSLETLSMTYAQQTTFPYLDGLNDTLIKLDLTGNRLMELDEENLNYLISLTTLRLDNNSITHLPPSLYGLASSLVELYVKYNQLDGRGLESLNHLRKLTKLDLSGNPLVHWPDFSYCAIDASNSWLVMNNIPSLPPLKICTFCHFCSFSMKSSHLKEYPNFSSCSESTNLNLYWLNFNDNQLGDSANESLVQALAVMKPRLLLNNNTYTRFPRFTDDVLNSIRRLELDGNSISALDEDIFEHLKGKIWIVKINRNPMKEMPYKLLSVTYKLYLQHNRIMGLNALEMNKALCMNHKFWEINLSNNDFANLYQFPNLKESLCQESSLTVRKSRLSDAKPKATNFTIKGVR